MNKDNAIRILRKMEYICTSLYNKGMYSSDIKVKLITSRLLIIFYEYWVCNKRLTVYLLNNNFVLKNVNEAKKIYAKALLEISENQRYAFQSQEIIWFGKNKNTDYNTFMYFLQGQSYILTNGKIGGCAIKEQIPVGQKRSSIFVRSDNKYGVFSHRGYEIVPFGLYDEIKEVSNKFLVKKENKETGQMLYGLLNYGGQIILNIEYRWIKYFNERPVIGFYAYKDNNVCRLSFDKWGTASVSLFDQNPFELIEKEHQQREMYREANRELWYAMTDGMYGDYPEDGYYGDYDFMGY